MRNEGGGGGFVIARALLVRWRKGLDDFAGSTKSSTNFAIQFSSLESLLSLHSAYNILCDVK